MKPPGPIETIRGMDEAGRSAGASPDVVGASADRGAGAEGATLGFAGAIATGFTGEAFLTAAFFSGSFAFTGDGRDFSPKRCALPITALRETPPSSSAI